MEKRVIKLRGYHLAAFKEYYYTQSVLLKDNSSIKCGMINPEATKELYEKIRGANVDIIIVDSNNDISHICEENCRKELKESEDCPNIGRSDQDNYYIKKYKFEVGKEYKGTEFLKLLGIEQGW